MAVTIYDVAARAGVSPATVSRVLNGTHVSADHAARVRAAAEELDFRPNRMARNLRRRRSEVIALVIPDIENPFFTALARGVEDRAMAAGYCLVLCNTDEQHEKESRYLDVARSEQMAGVILAPASAATDLGALLAARTPVVIVDRSSPHESVDAVVMDNERAASRATSWLYEQGLDRVACITGPADVETAQQRAAGWQSVFAQRTRLAPERYLRHADFRSGGGRAAMADLLTCEPQPDGVFVANNLMALGALEHLAAAGIEPGAFPVATIGAVPGLAVDAPGVHVLPWPGRPLGTQAADILLARLSGDDQPVRRVVVEVFGTLDREIDF